MCDNDAALQTIAHDIESIKNHLAKINGRLDKVEGITHTNEKEIAVMTTRCALLSEYEKENYIRIEKKSESWKGFLKDHIINIASILTILTAMAKLAGWF